MNLFAFRMAWRETRAAWRHFLYFFVCVALGVAALTGVGLFGTNVQRTVNKEARSLMAGDLEVRLSREMSQAGEQVLASLNARGVDAVHVSELVAMASVPPPDSSKSSPTRSTALQPLASQIVELKAVEAGYPFYGTFKVEPARPLMELLELPQASCPWNIVQEPPPPAPLSSQAAKKAKRKTKAAVQPAPPPPCRGAVVQEALLIRMGLKLGDRLKIGEASFVLSGILRKEPDRVAGAFSLGPRVLLSRGGLADTQLVKPGSRVRERYLLRVPSTQPVEPLLYELRGRLASETARVVPYQDAQPQLQSFLDQLTRYLGLVGLTALFIGGIGVASTMQAFLREKFQTIAILKTVGAETGTILRTYVLQALLLGVIGSLAGTALGLSIQGALPTMLASFIPVETIDLTVGVDRGSLGPIAKGLAMGVLTTLLFCLWPLLGIRDVRPASIFRRDVALAGEDPLGRTLRARIADVRSGLRTGGWLGMTRTCAQGLDGVRLGSAAAILTSLAGLAMWQAGSRNVGALFIGALAGAVVLLRLSAFALVRGLRFMSGVRSLSVRYAVGNLHRPGNQAVGVMVSIGIGVMVIVTVSLLERALVDQIGEQRPQDSPSFFFIDIQPDQKEAFLALLAERMPGVTVESTPLVRSRLYALNGQPVESEEAAERRAGPPTEEEKREKQKQARKNWYVTREYVLTQMEAFPKDNKIVRGRWWQPGERPETPLVSVEEDAALNLGLSVGGTVTLDIQGVTLEATVASLRKVEWGNFSTNFYMILSPGSLDYAPMTYVATIRVPEEQEVPLQQAVVAAFPNVTAINIGDVLDSLARILERLSLAIRAVALFCIVTGGIVMAAALTTTRYRRLYESVVLTALGATRGLIARTFATEYLLLGAIAGSIGVALSLGLSWALLTFIFELPWRLYPDVLLSGLFVTTVLALAVGFLSTFRLLGQRPLTVLRHE